MQKPGQLTPIEQCFARNRRPTTHVCSACFKRYDLSDFVNECHQSDAERGLRARFLSCSRIALTIHLYLYAAEVRPV